MKNNSCILKFYGSVQGGIGFGLLCRTVLFAPTEFHRGFDQVYQRHGFANLEERIFCGTGTTSDARFRAPSKDHKKGVGLKIELVAAP